MKRLWVGPGRGLVGVHRSPPCVPGTTSTDEDIRRSDNAGVVSAAFWRPVFQLPRCPAEVVVRKLVGVRLPRRRRAVVVSTAWTALGGEVRGCAVWQYCLVVAVARGLRRLPDPRVHPDRAVVYPLWRRWDCGETSRRGRPGVEAHRRCLKAHRTMCSPRC